MPSGVSIMRSMIEQKVPEEGPSWATAGDGEAARLAVLRVLAANPEISQRDLARHLGVSLGKTHYVLHALLDKGQLKIRNFRNSAQKLAYAYLLTPRGVAEKVRLTKRFLERKESEFQTLQQTIDTLRSELARLEQRPGAND